VGQTLRKDLDLGYHCVTISGQRPDHPSGHRLGPRRPARDRMADNAMRWTWTWSGRTSRAVTRAVGS